MSRTHKYGAIATWVDGIRFASKREAKRYGELRYMQLCGQIRDLRVQPAFPIEAVNPLNGEVTLVGVYRADFDYLERASGKCPMARIVEDVKGVRTPVYKLKKRLVEAQYGITITEVK